MIFKIRQCLEVIRIIKNFPLYFANYFKLVNKKYIIYKLRNGIKYKTRSGTTDRGIINEIFIYKEYNPRGFEIKKDDVVIDIGGHIGIFTILASKLAENGKIYVFEPMPENFNLLLENIRINNRSNVVAFKKAVASKNEKKDLFLSEGENKGGNSFYKKNENSRKIEVETLAFQDFIKKNKIKKIDFLKMDCEGGEYDILFKCPKETLKKISKISMEYHNLSNKNNGERLKAFLEKSGFIVIKKELRKRGMIYAKRE